MMEYGEILTNGFHLIENMDRITQLMKRMKTDYVKNIIEGEHSRSIDEIKLSGNDLIMRASDVDKNGDVICQRFESKFINGDYLYFKYYPEHSLFENILFQHSENGKQGHFKKYDNFDVELMYVHTPNHELLQAMNSVFEVFKDKDSAESQPAESGESSEMQ